MTRNRWRRPSPVDAITRLDRLIAAVWSTSPRSSRIDDMLDQRYALMVERDRLTSTTEGKQR